MSPLTLYSLYKFTLAFHLIGVFFWTAALFTLPRQLVYHCDSIERREGELSLRSWHERERRTFFYILTPTMLLSLATAAFMVLLLNPSLKAHAWIHWILLPTALLLLYQWACWHLMAELREQRKVRSRRFYLIFNELVAIPLIAIIFLVVFKPV